MMAAGHTGSTMSFRSLFPVGLFPLAATAVAVDHRVPGDTTQYQDETGTWHSESSEVTNRRTVHVC
jgi:hypothetical protein